MLFKTKAIILHLEKNSKNEFVYSVFSQEYGKILLQKKWGKKEKILDIAYIINAEIKTKQWFNIHKVGNIKIKSEFLYENKSFEEINEYLTIISIILKNCPFGLKIEEIFFIMEKVNEEKNINFQKLLITKLKIYNILWTLKTHHSNKIIEKILKFIDKNKIETLFKLESLDDNILNEMKKIG